jgi:hypothetical protein
MRPIRLGTIIAAALLFFSTHARAQNNDFFNRGGVGLFEPEIGVVNTGSQIVMAPTVSADRKYVTLGVRTQTARVIRIEEFPFFTGGFAGPVGNAQAPAAAAPNARFAEAMHASVPIVVRSAAGGSVLTQTGMTRIE